MGDRLPLLTGGLGGGQLYHALQRPGCHFEAGCRVLIRFSSRVPERDSFERRLLNNKKQEELRYLPGGAGGWDALNQVLFSKEDNFQALWRRRRIPKTKKISLAIPAKCGTAWSSQSRRVCRARDGFSGCEWDWGRALWAAEICNLRRRRLLLAARH